VQRIVVDRRTFLRLMGLGAGGMVAAQALRAARPAGVRAADDDPVATQAAALEFDMEAVHRFVANEIGYEPYAGVLRGAATTLAGRAGNAADKAVLLAALLDASFVEHRFVMGELPAAVADTLASGSVVADAVRDRVRAARNGPDEATGTLTPDQQALLDRLPEIDAAVTAWAATTVDSTVATIVDALAGAGIEVPAGAQVVLPELERTRHVWVQAASGAGWVDLDATLPATEPGTTIATPVGEPVEAIPDDLRYRIDLSVVAEHIDGDGLAQETLLEHSAFADELTDVPVLLGHAKPEGLAAVGVSIAGMLTGGVRYQTILRVGDEAYVTERGLLIAGDADDPLGLGASGRDGEATGEWLDIVVRAPDGTQTSTRRTVLDRVGEAARAAGAIDVSAIPVAELVDLGPDETQEYLPLRALRYLGVATGTQARPSLDPGDGRELDALGTAAPIYHLTRDAANALISLDRGVSVHLSQPNVVLHSYELAAGPGDTWSVVETTDLPHRGFGWQPVSGIPAGVPAGILAGVVSHVAERVQAGEGSPADLAPARPVLSAGALVDAAVAQGIGLQVVRDAVPAQLGLVGEAATALEAALAAGWVAVMPARPVAVDDGTRLGWWLVDPRTGATLDMLDDGRGTATLEEAVLLLAAGSLATTTLIVLGACVASTWRAVSETLRLNPGISIADVRVGRFACGRY